jgi:hypothetical protein
MKSILFKTGLLGSIAILLFSCGNSGDKLGDTLNRILNKAESLDSLLNQEVGKVLTLDSLINEETQKVQKLDSLIDNTTGRIDSLLQGKKGLLEKLIN